MVLLKAQSGQNNRQPIKAELWAVYHSSQTCIRLSSHNALQHHLETCTDNIILWNESDSQFQVIQFLFQLPFSSQVFDFTGLQEMHNTYVVIFVTTFVIKLNMLTFITTKCYDTIPTSVTTLVMITTKCLIICSFTHNTHLFHETWSHHFYDIYCPTKLIFQRAVTVRCRYWIPETTKLPSQITALA